MISSRIQVQDKDCEKIGDKILWKNCDGVFFACPTDWILLRDGKISNENLEAIKTIKQFLEINGVSLIIPVIPHFYDIAARKMFPAFRDVVDMRSANCVKQLNENGIEAIYLSDLLLNEKSMSELLFFYPGRCSI